jgi:hypothetical protein
VTKKYSTKSRAADANVNLAHLGPLRQATLVMRRAGTAMRGMMKSRPIARITDHAICLKARHAGCWTLPEMRRQSMRLADASQYMDSPLAALAESDLGRTVHIQLIRR